MPCCRSFRARFFLSIAILSGLNFLACTSLPRHPRPADFEGVGDGFSGELVEAHLKALWGLGARSPGSESDKIARAYLAREFRLSGAKLTSLDGSRADGPGGELGHLVVDLAGRSSDVVLLVAAYPVLDAGKEVDETGAAVLVELARVFGSREQPYTLRFALAETRPFTVASRADSTAPPGILAGGDDPRSEAREASHASISRGALLIEAGRDLARKLEGAGQSERVRAIIVLDLSFHSDLVVARDLRSHPGFRAIFWSSAARLGFEAMFPPNADWASPATLQLGFRERAMDRIVALVEVPPAPGMHDRGVSAPGTDREGTIRALDSLGQVVVDALGRLMERLAKVDAFSR